MIGLRTTRSAGDSERSRRSTTTTTTTTTGPASVIDAAALVPRSRDGLRTLDDVRGQVAQEIAIHTITKAKSVDGVRLAVKLVTSKSEDEYFLEQVTSNIQHQLTLHEHLFAVGTVGQTTTPTFSTLTILGSNLDFVQRAVLLVSSKFMGRILGTRTVGYKWIATIQDLGVLSYDEDALWDALSKAAQRPMDPLLPPPGSKGIDEILLGARAKLQRISPVQAYDELKESQVGAPTFLVDIRPQTQREREGWIDGALIVERNVLEWRFDPRSASRLAIADRYDLRIIIFCEEGFTSRVAFDLYSLAAYSLQQIGLLNATDIIGGYEAWKEVGLPVSNEPERRKPRSLVSLAGSVV